MDISGEFHIRYKGCRASLDIMEKGKYLAPAQAQAQSLY
jgi:hypothetical protein